jgi:hypothetical protein
MENRPSRCPRRGQPKSRCRAGVYAVKISEQVRTQPVNVAAGFQRFELCAAVKRLTGVKRLPDPAELTQGSVVERDVDDGVRRRVMPGHHFHDTARGELHGNRVAACGGREPDVRVPVEVKNGQLRVRNNAESSDRNTFLQKSGADARGIGQQAFDVRRSGEPDSAESWPGPPVRHVALRAGDASGLSQHPASRSRGRRHFMLIAVTATRAAANEDVHLAMAMYNYAVLQGLELETAVRSASHVGPVRCPGMAPARR